MLKDEKNLKVKIFYIGNSERAVRAVLPMALAEGGADLLHFASPPKTHSSFVPQIGQELFTLHLIQTQLSAFHSARRLISLSFSFSFSLD